MDWTLIIVSFNLGLISGKLFQVLVIERKHEND